MTTSSLPRPSLLSCLALSAVLMLSACVSYQPLHRTQTANLSKGISSADAVRIMGSATLLASYTFESGQQQYRADHYDLLTGTRQQMYTHCPSRRRACFPVIQNIPITDAYVVIYQSAADKVFAWGTVEELSRSPDNAISDLMPALKAAYAQQAK